MTLSEYEFWHEDGPDQEPVTVDYFEIVRETAAAVLLKMEDDIFAERIWVPKSQVSFNEIARTVTMPEWLALEKGLI